jgi:hypothetical protein
MARMTLTRIVVVTTISREGMIFPLRVGIIRPRRTGRARRAAVMRFDKGPAKETMAIPLLGPFRRL